MHIYVQQDPSPFKRRVFDETFVFSCKSHIAHCTQTKKIQYYYFEKTTVRCTLLANIHAVV